MLLEGIDRKLWDRYERGVEFYRRHPFGYKLKLGFLLLQSLIAALLVTGVCIWLCAVALENPGRHFRLLAFLLINALLSVWFYWAAMRERPWLGMILLDPEQYPGFYRKVNRIARLMGAPKIHRIYLSLEFNAAVASEWTLVPGLRRNVLMLGYPLLAALSSKALIGVLAHELGHVAGRHLSVKGIFVRIEVFWHTLQLGIFTYLLRPWRNYFLKTLTRTLHPLYLEHEKEADRRIEQHFGRDYLLQSLSQLAVRARIYENDRLLLRRMATASIENLDFAGHFSGLFETAPANPAALLVEALQSRPPITDEHPSFLERLAGASPAELLAASTMYPDAVRKLLRPGEDFRESLNAVCRERFAEYAAQLQQEYRNAQALLAAPPPNDSEQVLLERAEALELLERDDESAALLDAALQRQPRSAMFCATYLMRRLEQSKSDAERGLAIADMETLLDESPLLAYRLNDPLIEYYLRHGLTEKLKSFLDLRSRTKALHTVDQS